MAERIRRVPPVVDVADTEILLIDGSTNTTRAAIREVAAIAPPPLDDPSRASDGGTTHSHVATVLRLVTRPSLGVRAHFHVSRETVECSSRCRPVAGRAIPGPAPRRYARASQVAFPCRRPADVRLGWTVTWSVVLRASEYDHQTDGPYRWREAWIRGGHDVGCGPLVPAHVSRATGRPPIQRPWLLRAPAPAPERRATGATRKRGCFAGRAVAWLSIFDGNGR